MIPGMNPRDMQKAMQRMGIKQQEIDATEVVIRTTGKTLVIRSPQVVRINMMGQDSFQVSGRVEEADEAPQISGEDVQAVVQQANCSEEEAKKALEESGGDIAAAILKLQS
ncbi:TPA: nascent polypeptide-associated complex protein [Candidatus Woesearchaeota archaeon]|nr:nascent polypeptide-associated complex protein [Candidatus Woesearchaeota archaeon]HIH91218.1 nascent polypeptide-associated complex protein [Candidatus Woesearchaeota archaeon]HII63944.1 nascent polypeptide-associated complex protein [Candidatus Woesearchaeota archaeon]HII65853.1 nascent polypeptide-associated complex protein [Candidatus Woesearchaeota archaeon]